MLSNYTLLILIYQSHSLNMMAFQEFNIMEFDGTCVVQVVA